MRLRLDGSFLKSVGLLVGGSIVAQAIAFAGLFVGARLYTPEHFRLLSAMMGIITTFGAVACLRFELAIPMPKSDDRALKIVGLALATSVLVSSGVAVLVICASEFFAATLFRSSGATAFMWIIPLGVFLNGVFNALQMLNVRKKAFSNVALAKVFQACSVLFTYAVFAQVGFKPIGLLFANGVVNFGAGALVLGRCLMPFSTNRLRCGGLLKRFSLLAVFYRRYPTFSALEALANAAGLQVPLLIIAAAAPGPEAGFLMLAMTVMQAPIGLLGNSVSHVYFSRASEAYRAGTLGALTSDVMLSLIKIGLGPLIFAGLVAPAVFPVVFGSGWARAGVLVSWMTPWIIAQFLAVPIGTVFYVCGRQKASLLIQLFGFAVRLVIVLLAWAYAPNWLSEAYSVGGALYYVCYLAGALAASGGSLPRGVWENGAWSLSLAFWVGGAVIVRYLL